MANDQQLVTAWDASYARRENHVFYPSDEVVRFVARHLRRRISIDEVVDVVPGAKGARVVDVCCGIGRNLVFGSQMGLSMYGMDLSQHAIDHARRWLTKENVADADSRAQQGDVRKLAWADGYFEHAMCESALDSMPYSVAQQGVAEIARVTKQGGYFYCSLISGDETGRDKDFDGEEMVDTQHEKDTIQSYFNEAKVRALLEPHFEIASLYLLQTQVPAQNARHGRWHAVCRRK